MQIKEHKEIKLSTVHEEIFDPALAVIRALEVMSSTNEPLVSGNDISTIIAEQSSSPEAVATTKAYTYFDNMLTDTENFGDSVVGHYRGREIVIHQGVNLEGLGILTIEKMLDDKSGDSTLPRGCISLSLIHSGTNESDEPDKTDIILYPPVKAGDSPIAVSMDNIHGITANTPEVILQLTAITEATERHFAAIIESKARHEATESLFSALEGLTHKGDRFSYRMGKRYQHALESTTHSPNPDPIGADNSINLGGGRRLKTGNIIDLDEQRDFDGITTSVRALIERIESLVDTKILLDDPRFNKICMSNIVRHFKGRKPIVYSGALYFGATKGTEVESISSPKLLFSKEHPDTSMALEVKRTRLFDNLASEQLKEVENIFKKIFIRPKTTNPDFL